MLVDLDDPAAPAGGAPEAGRRSPPTGFPSVVVGVSTVAAPFSHPLADWCDTVAGAGDAELIAATVRAAPLAAVAFAVLLRDSEHRSVEHGLAAESAVYSLLQAGPEFGRWRAGRPPGRPDGPGPAVRLERHDDALTVTLDRPHRHNAVDTALRDGLCEALTVALADDTVRVVHLRGAGPSFCSGGDLDRFGTFPDPASAHVVRLTRSPARLLAALADRLVVHVHGHALGAGCEWAAFAADVAVSPGARFGLPEIALGLVPGAGGTVSLPRRIGRHRTAWLGLTGERVDATTALAWGLADRWDHGGRPGATD